MSNEFPSSNVCKVTATSSLVPNGELNWRVDTGSDIQAGLVYSNLMYDIVGLALGKLGVEYSKWLLDKDSDRLNAEIEKVQTALRSGSAAS